MQRRNILLMMALLCLGGLSCGGETHGNKGNASLDPEFLIRASASDLIFTGKILRIEEKDIRAKGLPGSPQEATYRIALVQVGEVIKGKSPPKTVRFGFRPEIKNEDGKTVQVGPPRSEIFAAGKEGLFSLTLHHGGEFYEGASFDRFTTSEDDSYANELEAMKVYTKLLEDPKGSLRSKDESERLATAGLLLFRYRIDRNLLGRTEEIDADESRLILGALEKADWQWETSERIGPYRLFSLLHLGAEDGWVSQQDLGRLKEPEEKALAWIRSHRDYRIRRSIWEQK